MGHWLRLALCLTVLCTVLIDAYPSGSIAPLQRPARRRHIKRGLLVPRNDEFMLGEDWGIITMDNGAAYVPHQRAARDLEDFYSTLHAVASLRPPIDPGHHFVHRINRVLITFHARGITVPVDLIRRFADAMLTFTRQGYTSAYRMRFRHLTYGFILEVTMTVDDEPPAAPDCAVSEEHGQVNASGGIRQVCIMRPLGINPPQ